MKSVGLKSRLDLNVKVNVNIAFKPQSSHGLESQPTLLIRAKRGQISTYLYTTQSFFEWKNSFAA